jgi:hypothetical protein
MGSPTSHNPTGLHDLLQGELYFFTRSLQAELPHSTTIKTRQLSFQILSNKSFIITLPFGAVWSKLLIASLNNPQKRLPIPSHCTARATPLFWTKYSPSQNVINNTVFWKMTPCGFIINRSFGGTCRLHLQGRRNGVREEKC